MTYIFASSQTISLANTAGPVSMSDLYLLLLRCLNQQQQPHVSLSSLHHTQYIPVPTVKTVLKMLIQKCPKVVGQYLSMNEKNHSKSSFKQLTGRRHKQLPFLTNAFSNVFLKVVSTSQRI